MRIARPATFTRELVKTDARLVVPAVEPGIFRRVLLMVPPGSLEVYAALDVVLVTPELAGGQSLPANAINPDRFVFQAPRLPANREVPFDLFPHQTIHVATYSGVLALGVLTNYYLAEG